MANAEPQTAFPGTRGRTHGIPRRSSVRRASRLFHQARLGSVLLLRGLLLALRGSSVADVDPTTQRRRWEETTLASEAFRWTTTFPASPDASLPALSPRRQERAP